MYSEGEEITLYKLDQKSKLTRPTIKKYLKLLTDREVLVCVSDKKKKGRKKKPYIPTLLSITTLLILYQRLERDINLARELPDKKEIRKTINKAMENLPFKLPILQKIIESEDPIKKLKELLKPIQEQIIFNIIIQTVSMQKKSIKSYQPGFSNEIRKIPSEAFFDDVLKQAKLLRLLILLDTQPKKDYKKKLKEAEKKTIVEELEITHQQFKQMKINLEIQLITLPSQLRSNIIQLEQAIQKLNYVIKNI